MKHSLLITAVLPLALLAPPQVQAQMPKDITAGEMVLLPEYCRDTQGFGYNNEHFNPSPRAPHWVSLMGATFWDMHHYCWALIKRRRAMAPGVKELTRRNGLNSANGDLKYILDKAKQHGQPDFVMIPELLTVMGDNHRDMGDLTGAMAAYESAVRQKADYWPPYVRWADILKSVGMSGDARRRVEQGLRASPDSTQLRDKLRELGGDPEAFVRSLPPPPPPPAPASQASQAKSP